MAKSRRRPKNSWLPVVFSLLGATLVLFIVLPLGRLIFSAETGRLLETLTDSVVMSSIGLTILAALAATAIGLVLGVPLAYLLAHYRFPGKRLLEGVVNLPVVIPHSAAGIALLFVFGRSFWVGQRFEDVGIEFVDSIAGIIIAMLFVSVPFLLNAARDGFSRIDDRLIGVARTLGASPSQAFIQVALPLARRNILSGGLMMWARSMSEFGAVIILAYHPMIAPVLVYERFQTQGLAATVPIAALLVIISLIIFIGIRLLLSRGANAGY
ncbi:ABC transporter permease [Dehalogenimonas sp. THU2]|uniref:ABC transporter permease n=1 Tax=Dehalogenimonas sp. THU2 TaxID=3151121 RepID=UPI003218CA23